MLSLAQVKYLIEIEQGQGPEGFKDLTENKLNAGKEKLILIYYERIQKETAKEGEQLES